MDDLLGWIIVTLPGAEFQALLTESNQIVAALRLTTYIEELANASTTCAA